MSIRGALQIAYGTKSFPVPLNHLTIDSIRCPFINQLLGWYCDNRDDEVPDGSHQGLHFCNELRVNSSQFSIEIFRKPKVEKAKEGRLVLDRWLLCGLHDFFLFKCCFGESMLKVMRCIFIWVNCSNFSFQAMLSVSNQPQNMHRSCIYYIILYK